MKNILAVLLLSAVAFAQGGVQNNAALKSSGGPAAGATVRVCSSTATGTPCLPLATIYSDSDLSIPKANPFTADAYGNYSYFGTAGLYKEQVTVGTTTHTSIVQIAPLSITTNSSLTILNGIRFCDQYGGFTAAAIQSCINDTPDGGTAFLAAGTWDLSANLPITITKSIKLGGAGWGTILRVGAAVGATTDVFLIQPPLNIVLHGGLIKDFAIIPASGTPARHAFHLDGTNGEILNWVFDHIRVEQLGGNSVYAEGSGYDTLHSAQGTPVLTTFQNSLWRGGFTFTNSGDTNRILNNQITGNGKAIEVSMIAGATALLVKGNNITSNGGSHFGTNVSMPQITGNEFETFASFSGSNGAVLDFDGTSGSHVLEATIRDNHISVVNGITADAIRLNYSDGAIIDGNTFALGAGASHDIIATANSIQNAVLSNAYGTSTTSSFFNDSGTGNVLFTLFSNGQMLMANNRPLAAIDDAGTGRNMILMQTSGSVLHYGYRGQKALEGVSGATYLYDGSASNRIGAAVGVTNSSVPDSATVLSAYKNYAGAGGVVVSTVASIDGGTGKGTFNGGVQPAATGTALTWFQKATHASLDLASVATAACTSETTETITGAALGDSCNVSSGTALEAGGFFRCAVTATDTAKWQLCNLSGGAIDRASDTYTIRVTR